MKISEDKYIKAKLIRYCGSYYACGDFSYVLVRPHGKYWIMVKPRAYLSDEVVFQKLNEPGGPRSTTLEVWVKR